MLDKIISDLALQNALIELSNDDWFFLSISFAKEADQFKKNSFIKALSAHTGISEECINNAFVVLNSELSSNPDREQILLNLQLFQSFTTIKIRNFQQHTFFKTIDLDSLSISRSQWNKLIYKFERLERSHITNNFFFTSLSLLQKVSADTLIGHIKTVRPHRSATTKYSSTLPRKIIKRTHHYGTERDESANSLIYENRSQNEQLVSQLEDSGVRIVPSLEPATPERGHRFIKRTPGKTKVRLFCDIDGNQFFQPKSPVKSSLQKNGRIDISDLSQEKIKKALPRLLFNRAEPVEYTARLAPILERSGLPRMCSARTLMGASASEVFEAHGIEIQTTDKHSHHWSHLIAHFLADEKDIISMTPDEELINLVPTTAAANYNTLETVELFIREKLISQETEEIDITVTPVYSQENLIPDLLVYALKWFDLISRQQHHEQFYINPQSYIRITKSMHESISLLREARVSMFPN